MFRTTFLNNSWWGNKSLCSCSPMWSNIMHIAAMHDNKDDLNKDDHNKDDYNKDYLQPTYWAPALYMALIINGIKHKTMTTSITKCILCFQNSDFLKLETFFLKCRLFSKWRQGNYILIQSILWWPRSPSAISSQKAPKAKMRFVFSVIYISILNMGAVAYSSTPVDLVFQVLGIILKKY